MTSPGYPQSPLMWSSGSHPTRPPHIFSPSPRGGSILALKLGSHVFRPFCLHISWIEIFVTFGHCVLPSTYKENIWRYSPVTPHPSSYSADTPRRTRKV